MNQLDDTGFGTNAYSEVDNFKEKIVNFGAAHNRRLCYIIELDKDITDSGFNPLTDDTHAYPNDVMNADFTNSNYCDIELRHFLGRKMNFDTHLQCIQAKFLFGSNLPIWNLV